MYCGVSEQIVVGDCSGGDLHLLIEQYTEDLRNNEECARCDVCYDKDRPGDVLLLKMFHSAEAAERHDASDLRRDFEMASTPMIQSRKVQYYSHVG